jgi:hypothetical protein
MTACMSVRGTLRFDGRFWTATNWNVFSCRLSPLANPAIEVSRTRIPESLRPQLALSLPIQIRFREKQAVGQVSKKCQQASTAQDCDGPHAIATTAGKGLSTRNLLLAGLVPLSTPMAGLQSRRQGNQASKIESLQWSLLTTNPPSAAHLSRRKRETTWIRMRCWPRGAPTSDLVGSEAAALLSYEPRPDSHQRGAAHLHASHRSTGTRTHRCEGARLGDNAPNHG